MEMSILCAQTLNVPIVPDTRLTSLNSPDFDPDFVPDWPNVSSNEYLICARITWPKDQVCHISEVPTLPVQNDYCSMDMIISDEPNPKIWNG